MSGDEPSSIENLLTIREKQLEWKHRAHMETARMITLKNSGIGYLAAVFSAIVGTSVFATLQSEVSLGVRLLVIVLSLSAAVLSAIQSQTRSDFLEQAEKHRIAGAKYGNLKREIEQIKASSIDDAERKGRINEIEERFDKLELESPRIPKYAARRWRAGKPPAGAI